MSGISKYEGKDRRRQRLRNRFARDLKVADKQPYQRDRKRRKLDENSDEYFFDDDNE